MRTLIRLLIAALLGHVAPAAAEVVRFEVTMRGDVADGRRFGVVGAYERVSGRIVFALDPGNAANRIIADIDRAPRNAAGQVEFSADFYMLKPKRPSAATARCSSKSRTAAGRACCRSSTARPPAGRRTAEEMGDGFLMTEGFTLLWVGWQFDVPRRRTCSASTRPSPRRGQAAPRPGPQ